MDKEKNTRLPLVDLIEVKPMQDGYRWVAITGDAVRYRHHPAHGQP